MQHLMTAGSLFSSCRASSSYILAAAHTATLLKTRINEREVGTVRSCHPETDLCVAVTVNARATSCPQSESVLLAAAELPDSISCETLCDTSPKHQVTAC